MFQTWQGPAETSMPTVAGRCSQCWAMWTRYACEHGKPRSRVPAPHTPSGDGINDAVPLPSIGGRRLLWGRLYNIRLIISVQGSFISNYKDPHSCKGDKVLSFEWGFFFEWGVYALSASKAIFRARTYNCITYSVRWWWLLDEWN